MKNRVAFEMSEDARGLDLSKRLDAPWYDSKDARIAYFKWEDSNVKGD